MANVNLPSVMPQSSPCKVQCELPPCSNLPDPGVVQQGGCGGPQVGLLLERGAHKVPPLGGVALREVDLVAVHDQRRGLYLRCTRAPLFTCSLRFQTQQRPGKMPPGATGVNLACTSLSGRRKIVAFTYRSVQKPKQEQKYSLRH